MKKIFKTFLILLISLGFYPFLSGQNIDRLPRSIPEQEGVSSAGIIDFLNAADTGRQEIHSFMFLRHGKVIAEGWWDPYGPDYKHLLYSASKTFTATAIGLAVSENRLKLTDKVVSFFPYSMPDSVGKNMKELTVGNLLTMSVGQDPAGMGGGTDEDWITAFLKNEPVHKPGTVFLYNNMATFMLSAIVQQVTGETTFDYLRPRIFDPLIIRGIDWDKNPQGINLGMIGLRLRTEDLAKFGQLLMQNGKWNNKQLIPETWVKEATSFKIESTGGSDKLPKDKNDWAQGYCYQMWRGRNNSVRLDGMAGQFVVLFPDRDAIVVFTANARNTQDELNLVHDYLLPAIKSSKSITPDPGSYNELKKKQSTLILKPQVSKVGEPEIAKRVSGKEFIMQENDYQIQSVYFTFKEGECSFAIKRNNQVSVVKAGLGSWKITNSKATSLLAPPRPASKSIDARYNVLQPVIRVGTSYSWSDPNTLELTARFIEESLGTQEVVCRFSVTAGSTGVTIGPKSAPGMMGSQGRAQPAIQLRGVLANTE
ncbi:MAG TPA: serine hydrolase [Bacteroidales bacterium]|nr:serine hydrolase [Bacteroidales bacterium]